MSVALGISDLSRRVVRDGERLVDFSPVHEIAAPDRQSPLVLFLTDRRLVAVALDLLATDPEAAIREAERAQVSFVMLAADALRLLFDGTAVSCRFPSPAAATAFRRGLLR